LLLKVQLDYLVGQIAHRLSGALQTTIQKELTRMTDVVADLSAQVSATLATLDDLLAKHQADVTALAAIPVTPDNTAALEAQIAALKDGTDKVRAALASVATATAASAASAAAPAAPAAAPAPTAPAESAAPAAAPAAPGTTA
jgi:hypothetical protein